MLKKRNPESRVVGNEAMVRATSEESAQQGAG